MASLILLITELLRPQSSSLAILSSQPLPKSSTSSNNWSFSTSAARRFNENNREEAEATAVEVEDLQEPRVCVDLVWP